MNDYKMILHTLFLLIFVLVGSISIQAQGWFQYYPNDGVNELTSYGNEEMISSIEKTYDGGYLGIGVDGGSANLNVGGWTDIKMVKTDAFGEQQWMNFLSGSNFITDEAVIRSFDVAVTPDNNYLVPLLIKTYDEEEDSIYAGIYWLTLDSNGEFASIGYLHGFEEALKVGSVFYNPNSLKISATNDGNYILASVVSEECPIGACEGAYYIAKTDEIGNILWHYDIPFEANFEDYASLYDIAPMPNGGYVFTRYIGSYGDADGFEVVALDEDGNLLWTTENDIPPIDFWKFTHLNKHIDFTSDGNIVLVADYSFVDGEVEQNQPIIIEINSNTGVLEQYIQGIDIPEFDAQSNRVYNGFCVRDDSHILLTSIKQEAGLFFDGEEFVSLRISEVDLTTGTFVANYDYEVFNSDEIALANPAGEIKYTLASNIICNDDNSLVIAGRGQIYDDNLGFDSPIIQMPYMLKVDGNNLIYSSQVCGTLFEDENENCVQDAEEIGLAGRLVSLASENRFTLTDSLGNYCFGVNAGTYIVTNDLENDTLWTGTCAFDELTVNIGNDTLIENINFGYIADYDCPYMTIAIGTPLLRRCFSNIYTVDYCNNGGVGAMDATVKVTFDAAILLNDAEVPYTEVGSDNEYIFEIGDVGVGECGTFKIMTTVDCDMTLGAAACVKAHIYPDDVCGEVNELWDMSDIEVEATCEGDSIEFVLRNVGEPMAIARSYILYEDDLLESIGDFILDIGEEMIFKYPTQNGATYRLIAEESEFAPNISDPQVVVEMCGDAPFSTGFVTSFATDDDEHYIDSDCKEIIGSFDPNDKLVVPSGVGDENYVKSTDELEYTIRFQNTGNDTAFNIYILDTISPLLDMHTFESSVSSHSYTIEILQDSIIRWNFNDVYLPDSNINEIESHGFVKFFISPKADVAQESVINNSAGIYFDFNVPVITENIFVTICDSCVIQRKTRYVHTKIFLEGAYEGNGQMHNLLNPYLPLAQPYNISPYHHTGQEAVENIPTNAVDWVLVELRTGTPNLHKRGSTTTKETRAGLLLQNGDIVDIDGVSPLAFENTVEDKEYYFCIRHRNHLDVLSAYATMTMDDMYYNFTLSVDQAIGTQQMKLSEDGTPVLYVGDYNSDGIIQISDYDVWKVNPAILEAYEQADGTLDGIIQNTDFDAWRPNKAKIGTVEIGF